MTPVEEQVKQYARYLVEDWTPAAQEGDGPRDPAGRPREHRWLAAAFVVLVVIAATAIAFVARRDSTQPTVTQPTDPDAVQSTGGPARATAAKGPLQLTLWVSNTAPGPAEQVKATLTAENIGAEAISIPPMCGNDVSLRNDRASGDAGSTVPSPSEADPVAVLRDRLALNAQVGGVFTTQEADTRGTVEACNDPEPLLLAPGETSTTDGFLTVGRFGLSGTDPAVHAQLTFGDDSLPLDPWPDPEDQLRHTPDGIDLVPDEEIQVAVVRIPIVLPEDPPELITRREAGEIALSQPEIIEWARERLRAGQAYESPAGSWVRREDGRWMISYDQGETGRGFEVAVDDSGVATILELRS